MSVTKNQLLSNVEFCKLRYDIIPVKTASANFFAIPITQKCQILSCDTLVANERYIAPIVRTFRLRGFAFTWKVSKCVAGERWRSAGPTL
jgi:hypothetical protein